MLVLFMLIKCIVLKRKKKRNIGINLREASKSSRREQVLLIYFHEWKDVLTTINKESHKHMFIRKAILKNTV